MPLQDDKNEILRKKMHKEETPVKELSYGHTLGYYLDNNLLEHNKNYYMTRKAV